MRVKLTVRLKWAQVNSAFLVQLRKKAGRGLRGPVGMEQILGDLSFLRWMTGVFVSREWREENLAEWTAGLSTGRAQEMQKGSGS
jgi:hypothetical protein